MPLNEYVMPLPPASEIRFPEITIGLFGEPIVAKVLAEVLPPATRIPLPPLDWSVAWLIDPKSEIMLLLIVPVVMFAVVPGLPWAKTWIASRMLDEEPPVRVLPEMLMLLIVPLQVSIMIPLRWVLDMVLPVIVTTPSTVLSLKVTVLSTNAMEFSSYCPAAAVPVFEMTLLVKLKFVTLVPSIPLRLMFPMNIRVNEMSCVSVSEMP